MTDYLYRLTEEPKHTVLGVFDTLNKAQALPGPSPYVRWSETATGRLWHGRDWTTETDYEIEAVPQEPSR